MKKYLFTILLLFNALLVFSQVRVKASLDTPKILMGGQTHWAVSVSAPGGAKIEYAQFADTTNIPKGVEVLEQHTDTLREEGTLAVTFQRTLTAWETRNFKLPAVTVKVNGKPYTTAALAFDVQEVRADTAATAKARPGDSIQKPPFLLAEWMPYFWLSVFALLLLVLAYMIGIRLKNQKPLVKKRKPQRKLLPHEKAMQAIEKVKSENDETTDDQKAYYTALIDILREYLTDRFGINAMEMTSAEIVETLRKEDSREKIEELERVFATADLVKFAKYSTESTEKNYYLGNVVDFIEETKAGYQPRQETKETVTEQEDQRNQRMRRVLRLCKYLAIVAALALFAIVATGIMELTS